MAFYVLKKVLPRLLQPGFRMLLQQYVTQVLHTAKGWGLIESINAFLFYLTNFTCITTMFYGSRPPYASQQTVLDNKVRSLHDCLLDTPSLPSAYTEAWRILCKDITSFTYVYICERSRRKRGEHAMSLRLLAAESDPLNFAIWCVFEELVYYSKPSYLWVFFSRDGGLLTCLFNQVRD